MASSSSSNFNSNPKIAHHLSDPTLTPIITSSTSNAQAQALTALTSTALTAYDAASRLGLGVPQRIMIESSSSGPLILHTYLPPPSTPTPRSRNSTVISNIIDSAREGHRPLSGTTEGNSSETDAAVNGLNGSGSDEEPEERTEGQSERNVPPLLIGTVVARTAGSAGDARRAAARLERTGRLFQREWVARGDEGGEVGEG